MRRVFALLLICSALLAACESGSTIAHPMPMATAPVTTTIARQPVVLAVSATSQGTVAAKDVRLDTKVAITNNTSADIAIIGPICFFGVPIRLQLYDSVGQVRWDDLKAVNGCPLGAQDSDVQSIVPGATYVWRATDDIFKWPNRELQAGITYTLLATLWLWHQGDLSHIGTPTIPQGSNVMAETPIIFA